MSQSSIHEAKTQLSKLIQQALAGEEVIIAKAGKPVVRLVPIEQTPVQRQLGGWTGKFWMAEDFDQTPVGFEECLS
jgi:prevent-host-death family protein